MTRAQLLRRTARGEARRGAVAMEVAVLLSAICPFCLMAVDLARVFHAAAIVDNCARNGALAWADPRIARQLECLDPDTGVVDVQKAALSGVETLIPSSAVTWEITDTVEKTFIKVTVEYQFDPVIKYPGALSQITRTAWMRKLPAM